MPVVNWQFHEGCSERNHLFFVYCSNANMAEFMADFIWLFILPAAVTIDDYFSSIKLQFHGRFVVGSLEHVKIGIFHDVVFMSDSWQIHVGVIMLTAVDNHI